jgi:DNA-binding CsgD family transcriptional regulator/tetratricopeptide (TPR) repeat protein
VSGTALVGRDAELDAIDRLIEAAARGESSMLLVRGEAGIGKTRLLDRLSHRAAERRFAVLRGRATELESDVPFAAVVEALEPLDDVALATPASPAERWRLHRGLRERLDALPGGHPFALVLDDVHWADPATLELLEHLMRRPPERPHLLVAALRPGDVAERLLAIRPAAALDLGPLAREAAEPLLAGLVDPNERERMFTQSGGNPLLLEELARAGPGAEAPGGIVAAIGAERAALPAPARMLLDGAAIAGDPFDLDLAAAAGGLDADQALTGLDALVERGLVRPDDIPRRFVFRHPVVRSAVHAAVPAGEEIAAHVRAARALEAAGAALPARARHLAHAAAPGDAESAATLRAAAALVRPQAPAIAADWLVAARRADPRLGADGQLALAETMVEAGRLEAALAVVDEAAVADGAADREHRVGLAVAGATVERLLGRHEAGSRRLERVLDEAPGSGLLMAHLAISAYELGAAEETAAWAQRARASDADRLVHAAAAAMLAPAHAFAGRADAARAEGDAAVEAVDRASDAELAGAGELLTAVAWGLLAVERFVDVLSVARRSALVIRATGNGPAAIALDVAAISALGLLGRIEEAVAAADEAEQAARVTGNDQAVQWALWMHAWALLERGDLDAALAAAEGSVDLAQRLDDSALTTIARAVLGAVLVARGEPARGRPLLDAYDLEPGWRCRWTPPLVEADLALGDASAAAAHADQATALAESTPLAGPRAAAGRAQALVALARGETARAVELAGAAVADAERVDGALDVARARLIAGRALAASDRDGALLALAAAEQASATAGAARVRDEALQEQRRLGRRVGRGGERGRAGGGVGALSPREREVAGLVADGRTNREIAARLFLSEKTIETVLSRVFRKLGVRSRAEVAARVAAAGQD